MISSPDVVTERTSLYPVEMREHEIYLITYLEAMRLKMTHSLRINILRINQAKH